MSLEEAKNPQTPKERLTELYQNKDERLRKFLALNPNTPVDLLMKLANDGFANLVVQNPLWEILYFENPSFLHEYPAEDLGFVKRFTFLTERFFFFIQSHPNPKVAEMLALNPNCTISKLERLATHKESMVRAEVARHPRATPKLVAQLINDEATEVRAAAYSRLPKEMLSLASRLGATNSVFIDEGNQDQTISQEELRELSGLGDWFASLVARHPNIGAPLLISLSQHPNSMVRECVVRSPNCSPEILQNLSSDPSEAVRVSVASCPRCPKKALEALSNDTSERVCAAIAENKLCSGSILERFSTDPRTSVVQAVAKNINTPVPMLRSLSTHPDSDIRFGVASNPNTPAETLAGLLCDEATDVRTEASAHPKAPFEILDVLWSLGSTKDLLDFKRELQDLTLSTDELEAFSQYGFWASLLVLYHPSAKGERCEKLSLQLQTYLPTIVNETRSQQVLAKLSFEPDASIRLEVAANHSTSSKVLERLSKDTESLVREWVAYNPSCPPEALEAFYPDATHQMKTNILKNPSCPHPLVEKVLQEKIPSDYVLLAANPSLSTEDMERIFAVKDVRMYRALASNPGCPSGLLEKIFRERPQDVQRDIARHVNCPAHLFEELIKTQELDVLQNPRCPASVLESCAAREDQLVHFLIVGHKHCPQYLREKLLQSEDLVKYTINRADEVSLECLEAINAEDPYIKHLLKKKRKLAALRA